MASELTRERSSSTSAPPLADGSEEGGASAAAQYQTLVELQPRNVQHRVARMHHQFQSFSNAFNHSRMLMPQSCTHLA